MTSLLGIPQSHLYFQQFHYRDPEGRDMGVLEKLAVPGLSSFYGSKIKERKKHIVVDNPKMVP